MGARASRCGATTEGTRAFQDDISQALRNLTGTRPSGMEDLGWRGARPKTCAEGEERLREDERQRIPAIHIASLAFWPMRLGLSAAVGKIMERRAARTEVASARRVRLMTADRRRLPGESRSRT